MLILNNYYATRNTQKACVRDSIPVPFSKTYRSTSASVFWGFRNKTPVLEWGSHLSTVVGAGSPRLVVGQVGLAEAARGTLSQAFFLSSQMPIFPLCVFSGTHFDDFIF